MVVQARAEATRRRIIDAAIALFSEEGYGDTGLAAIMDRADVSKGAFYYHFESKDQILGEVLDKGIQVVTDAVRQRVDALPAGATARQRVAAAIEGHLWGLLHHGDFTSANIRIYGQIPPAAKNRHRKIRRDYADYWDGLLEDALKRGELRSDTSTAMVRLFVIGALNWTVEWYNPQKGSFDDFVEQITTIVFDGTFVKE